MKNILKEISYSENKIQNTIFLFYFYKEIKLLMNHESKFPNWPISTHIRFIVRPIRLGYIAHMIITKKERGEFGP